jgi:hypothetical protein
MKEMAFYFPIQVRLVPLQWKNHHHPYNVCRDAVNIVQYNKYGAKETFTQECNAAEKYSMN